MVQPGEITDTRGMEGMAQQINTTVSAYLTPAWLLALSMLFLAIWSGAAGRALLFVQHRIDRRAHGGRDQTPGAAG